MKILDFNSQVFLAPMAGITDRPFRRLAASFGGGNIVSEMVAVNALERKNTKTCRIADVRDEAYPVVVQLVGSDPALFAEAAKTAADLGAHSLDINMGCPVRKIVNNNAGSSLMQTPLLAAKIIEATVAASALKVSVKFRKGWDHEHINAVEIARMCEESGAAYVTVHGRTRSDFYAGKADWDIIAAVKQAVKIPVVANGDVCDADSAAAILRHTGADGLMIGRAALGAPWLIADIDCFLKTGKKPEARSTDVVKEVLLRHVRSLCDYYGERTALQLSRKYVCWYCKGLHDAKRFREQYTKIDGMAEALAAAEAYFDGLKFGATEEKI